MIIDCLFIEEFVRQRLMDQVTTEVHNKLGMEEVQPKGTTPKNIKGTLSVKFGIYMRQMTIFGGGLNNCPTYF